MQRHWKRKDLPTNSPVGRTLNAKKTMTEYITANTFYGKTTDDYNQSVYGGGKSNNIFTLEYQWKDKPHRHVGDLCEWIKELQKEIEILSNNART